MKKASVRAARPEDHAAIDEFTRETFSWGDYVGEAFHGWLEEPDAQVFVATDDRDRPIALARVRMMSSDEVWLNAARVHPDFRRQGIGRMLNAAAVDWGRQRGALVARLMTEEQNHPAIRQVEAIGYRAVARWFHADRTIEPGQRDPAGEGLGLSEGPQRLTVAPAVDIEPAYLAWSSSELARAAHGLLPFGWSVRRMHVDDLAAFVRAATLFEAPAGWAALTRHREGEVFVPWLVTIPDDGYSFLRGITARASADGHQRVSLMLPRVPWLVAAADRAGFDVLPTIAWQLEIATS